MSLEPVKKRLKIASWHLATPVHLFPDEPHERAEISSMQSLGFIYKYKLADQLVYESPRHLACESCIKSGKKRGIQCLTQALTPAENGEPNGFHDHRDDIAAQMPASFDVPPPIAPADRTTHSASITTQGPLWHRPTCISCQKRKKPCSVKTRKDMAYCYLPAQTDGGLSTAVSVSLAEEEAHVDSRTSISDGMIQEDVQRDAERENLDLDGPGSIPNDRGEGNSRSDADDTGNRLFVRRYQVGDIFEQVRRNVGHQLYTAHQLGDHSIIYISDSEAD